MINYLKIIPSTVVSGNTNDELGAGILNVNRLIKKYADKGKVEFIEGATFKTIVPVNAKGFEGAVEGVNVEIEGVNVEIEEVNEGVNENDTRNDTNKKNQWGQSPLILKLNHISQLCEIID
jgi:hypothetical protein